MLCSPHSIRMHWMLISLQGLQLSVAERIFLRKQHLAKRDQHALGCGCQPHRCVGFETIDKRVASRVSTALQAFRQGGENGSPRESRPPRTECAGIAALFEVRPDVILADKDLSFFYPQTAETTRLSKRSEKVFPASPNRRDR